MDETRNNIFNSVSCNLKGPSKQVSGAQIDGSLLSMNKWALKIGEKKGLGSSMKERRRKESQNKNIFFKKLIKREKKLMMMMMIMMWRDLKLRSTRATVQYDYVAK